MIRLYESKVSRANRSQVIDSEIRVFKHPSEHYAKITANLLPILNSLPAATWDAVWLPTRSIHTTDVPSST